MYGQMTAGSWIYIGSQGIVQGTYETFAEVCESTFQWRISRYYYGNSWVGRHGRSSDSSSYDGGGVVIGIDVDRSRIEKRIETRYCDVVLRKS